MRLVRPSRFNVVRASYAEISFAFSPKFYFRMPKRTPSGIPQRAPSWGLFRIHSEVSSGILPGLSPGITEKVLCGIQVLLPLYFSEIPSGIS